MELWVCHLGRVEYREAAALQERLRERVRAEELPELMLLLEHPPVYTLGRRSDEDELLFGEAFYHERGIDIVRTPRGGKLTYHGPGQLVGYPVMRVGSVPDFILTMERSIVTALADAGLEAHTKRGHKHVGVWVGERKIASVGVHISHGVSAHGFAVNVDNDLDPGRGHRRGPDVLPQADGLSLRRSVRSPPAARRRVATGHRGARARLMDVGLAIFLTADTPHPAELAKRGEAMGYESLMVTEHTHIPVSAGMVARDGGPLAEHYRRTHDPFVALSFAAAATEKLVIGTSVCLVIEHDPIILAKQISSLQNLSGGRFVFGVGAGWNKQEMRNHGTDPATRHGNMRERVEAMKAIWTEDEAQYHGKHVDFDPIWQWPKPEVPVPVLVGGNGPRVEDRVLRYGDGWMPNMKDLGELRERVAALRERAGSHVPVTFYGATPETLEELSDIGVDRALIVLETVPE